MSSHAWPVDSYKELRYKHVRGQNTFSSCGPAALATLFGEFYGMKTGEEEIVEIIKPYLEEEIKTLKEGKLPEGGVSMLDLRKVSEKLGIPARGYEIPEKKLFPIIEQVKIPLLLHLDRPEDHFVLSVIGYRDQIVLADPSWGIRLIGKERFFSRWDGLVLAFSPDKNYKSRAKVIASEIRHRVKMRRTIRVISRSFLWTH